MRIRTDELYKNTSEQERLQASEVVLDLAEVPFVREKKHNTVIQKLKVSDDQTKIAFILDVGNTERQTLGIRNMEKNYYSPLKIDNVCQAEFASSSNIMFYTSTDQANRPSSVKMMDLESGKTTTIFTDDDPTHYIDLGVTKDKKFLIIASNTKEDSEIWILPRDIDPAAEVVIPFKLINRRPEVKAHIDHIRDFFVTITTDDAFDYRVAAL